MTLIIKIEKVLFSGKRAFPWNDVEGYLTKYENQTIVVRETGEKIQIGARFSNEYCRSEYTINLHGTLEKAKANASQILVELIENATNRRWVENKDVKHNNDAKGGWYRYDVFFSMPVVFDGITSVNEYRATLLARINDKGIYLHDLVNIKKEDSNPLESDDRTV